MGSVTSTIVDPIPPSVSPASIIKSISVPMLSITDFADIGSDAPDLLALVPVIGEPNLLIISWVIYLLVKKTHNRIAMSNIALVIAFIGIWGLVIYRLYDKFNQTELQVDATWFGILNSFFINLKLFLSSSAFGILPVPIDQTGS